MKLKKDVIRKADIAEYLKTQSDFAFELEVQNVLVDAELDPEHAGSYEDPVTGKTREFDFRLAKEIWRTDLTSFQLRIAVECKNIRDYSPLVVHCLPRTGKEAYTCLVHGISTRPTPDRLGIHSIVGKRKNAERILLEDKSGLYPKGTSVGKNCDQVSRNTSGVLVGSDGEVFDKISQAVSSLHDLITHSYWSGNDAHDVLNLVVPMLVIPDERLWLIEYDALTGERGQPRQADRVSYYLDKDWLIEGSKFNYAHRTYTSHLEICTIGSLRPRVGEIMSFVEGLESQALELILGETLS